MADYNVQFPDGTPLTIQTGTINNTYDIPLVGQDAINYGDDFATSYIRLLVNFADTSAPTFGTTRKAGQLWYDTTPSTGGLNVYDGTGWDGIALDANIVHRTGAESIAGIKTFSAAADFTAAGSPFTVNSSTLVSNLNAELLNGNADTAFATAAQGVTADGAEPDLLLPPTNGYILSSTTGGARSWVSPAAGTGNTNPQDVSGFATPASTSVLLVDDPTGDQQPGTDSGLTYNATTNTLSTTTFVGNLTGNASTATLATTATSATTSVAVTVADESGDTSCNVLFVTAATGDLPPKSGTNLTFNSNSGLLTATTFSGSGATLTTLNAANISSGVLAVARGGTGVTTSTGSGAAFVLSTTPTFTTSIITPLVNGATSVGIQYAGSTKIVTQDHTGVDNVSGATVVDGAGTARDIGFNVMDTTNDASATTVTLTQARVGHSRRATNSTGNMLYVPVGADTSIPVGSMWVVRNFTTSTGTVQLVAASTDSLRHYDGSGSTPPATIGSANPFTLARGGVATVVKVADGDYEMWGIGITGGA